MEMNHQAENLYVSFKVKDQAYALNTDGVDSIFELKQKLTPVPKSSECLMGLLSMRGELMPVIDLRRMMNFESMAQEEKDFIEMLHQRQQDHVNWVDHLKKTVEDDVPFTLATDHHKCAFGKWYDHYKAPNHAVALAMSSIDAPHQAIHRSALECLACQGDRERQRQIVKTMTIPAMNGVLKGVDQMISEFTATKREMCIALSHGTEKYCIAVDEILSVEKLENVQPMDVMGENELVTAYASSKGENHIMLIDQKQIFVLLRKNAPHPAAPAESAE